IHEPLDRLVILRDGHVLSRAAVWDQPVYSTSPIPQAIVTGTRDERVWAENVCRGVSPVIAEGAARRRLPRPAEPLGTLGRRHELSLWGWMVTAVERLYHRHVR